MTDSPTLSIIIRTLGRSHLAEALESLAAQQCRSFEAVVVDMTSGAARETIEAVRPRLPKLLHLEVPNRLNRSNALNFGIEQCTGDAVGILDDDGIYRPEHVGNLLDGLKENHWAGLVYTGVVRTTLTEEGEFVEEKKFSHPFDHQRLLVGNFIYATSLAFPKSLWREVGGYDRRFPVYEDWEFLIRATQKAPVLQLDHYSANPRNFTGSPNRANHEYEIKNCRRCSAALYWKHRRLYTRALFERLDPDGTLFPHVPRHGVHGENLGSLFSWWWYSSAPFRPNRHARPY